MQVRKRIKLVGINARFSHSCLALFYVRNAIENHCSHVLCELNQFTINDNYYEMLIRLAEGKPEYIMFSAAIWNSMLVETLAHDLVGLLPDCHIVIGGPQAQVLDEKLTSGQCTFVVGEIEGMPVSFYRELENKKLLPRYYSEYFKSDALDFPYPYRDQDFPAHLANRNVYYESSRGCPFSCSYCLSAAQHRLFHKDLEVVKTELRHLLRAQPKTVRFIDRTFNDNPQRALEILRFLKEEGGTTLFHFEMAPDRFTEEMLTFLGTIASGRFQFEIGIQSTNMKTLQAVHRRMDPIKAGRTVARLVKETNIHLHVDLILGLPFETQESFADSFRQVFSMGAHYIQMGLLKILPGTPLAGQADLCSYQNCHNPPYNVLQNRWLAHSTLVALYWFGETVERFVNNRYFPSLWRYLRGRGEDSFEFFKSLQAHCQNQGFFTRAATQEALCELLVQVAKDRADQSIFMELLRHDWLRCGFRFLPECVKTTTSEEAPETTRSMLYQKLPMEMAGVYDRSQRNHFFRKSFFLRVSADLLRAIGAKPSNESCICFLQDKEQGLFAFSKILIL